MAESGQIPLDRCRGTILRQEITMVSKDGRRDVNQAQVSNVVSPPAEMLLLVYNRLGPFLRQYGGTVAVYHLGDGVSPRRTSRDGARFRNGGFLPCSPAPGIRQPLKGCRERRLSLTANLRTPDRFPLGFSFGECCHVSPLIAPQC